MMLQHTCFSGSMLAKPPLWLAWPPLEAISRTSSLGLLNCQCRVRELSHLEDRDVPVGKVAGVVVSVVRHVGDVEDVKCGWWFVESYQLQCWLLCEAWDVVRS
jgi:hypothetical protein